MTKTLPVLSFAKLEMGMPMPHLLDIQTRAFQALLQPDGKGAERADVGLERVFKDLFPIQDVNGNYSLEFVKFALGEAKYTVEECIERDMTYSVPLKATLQLVVMEEVGEGKAKRPKNIIEKEVYLGELPILTPLGTFVINGAERVIVSQLHRSPGVVFEESIHPNGQRLFSARIIPFRGSWVEFTIDIHDVIFVHIDKKKKFPATALLRAFGYGTNAEILKLFYATKDIDITGKLEGRAQKREVLGTLLAADVPDPENKKGEALGKVGEELTLEKFNTFRRAGITRVKVFAGYTTLDLREDEHPTTTRSTEGKHILAFDVADPGTGEVLAEAGREVTDTMRKKLLKANVTRVEVLLPPGRAESPLIKNTLAKDPTHTEAEALEQIYQLLRPGEAPNLETAPQVVALVLPPQALRPGAGGPLQDQSAPQCGGADERHGPHRRGLHRDHPLPDRAARRPRLHGRHRPPRQPPRALGRRAHRQPVLGGAVADGAAHQGADEHQQRPRADHPGRSGERAHGERRDPGVLRQLAAVAVHGPDQPARRADPQAPALRARARRPDAGARGLRSPRRALQPVRPHVPDRNAGRAQHRPDHEPVVLRAGQ